MQLGAFCCILCLSALCATFVVSAKFFGRCSFQELDLTAGALLLGDETRALPWEQHLLHTLRKRGEFVVVRLHCQVVCVASSHQRTL